MAFTETSARLTDQGVMAMLTAAVQSATASGQPQCIVIVDASGVVLGSFRMTGSRYLSLKSATAKARTAASIGAATHTLPDHAKAALAAATGGDVTGLKGGCRSAPAALFSAASAWGQAPATRTRRWHAPRSPPSERTRSERAAGPR